VRPGLVVGSRGSQLAMIQTESVVARIKEKNPSVEIIIKKITTSGDKDRHTSLVKMGIAVFVKELEEALLEGRIDLAVHSLKDVPTELPRGLYLPAVIEREDPRDVLVAKARLDDLPSGARIGTDSLRRRVQLARYRPDLKIGSIRGNVDTRLRKVAAGEFDGVITAAAAMLRLGRKDEITEYLPVECFLPAVGQGAMVIEARQDDKEIIDLMAAINHIPTWRCVTGERAFLLTLGGGCRAPIASLATIERGVLKLAGMVASMDGSKMLYDCAEGEEKSPEEIGVRLAKKLLKAGAAEFIEEAQPG
jgi:hydroxymethylbilane synthase